MARSTAATDTGTGIAAAAATVAVGRGGTERAGTIRLKSAAGLATEALG